VPDACQLKRVVGGRQEKSSFLKKRTKKLLPIKPKGSRVLQ
jgi:hypothetical protein